ncbi:MAG: UDP-N-acetylmuramoyl-L-alanyl-D-glutamate--2,6-diaminopimelate ligase [bacterium]|nr:UDP-N-acetylmuramoyl-L-alanyl-D-glutamate--2,6-diaminopimelate ligase [bacterium]
MSVLSSHSLLARFRMLPLAKLSEAVGGKLLNAAGSEIVTGVSYDSRKVKPGDVFIAISGHKDDGAKYVNVALDRGASAVIFEAGSSSQCTAPTIIVNNARAALATVAWNLAGNPQRDLKLIGVTGTNGKTTVTAALAQLLSLCGRPTGVCGTLGMFFENYKFDSDRTTAEAPELAAAFNTMKSHGATHVALEATSIGLVMHRLDDLKFEIGIFTNLSRDHLDFHGTWEEYRRAKMMLFESIRLSGSAIFNADDPETIHFEKHTTRPALTYSIDSHSDFQATNLNLQATGTDFRLLTSSQEFHARTPLVGRFNVYNTLAIIAGANALGVSLDEIIHTLPQIRPVRGRAEVIFSNAPFAVLVDYAHTPDAVEKILSTVRELAKGKLLCVIGAGGDRDRGKRPLMAQAAEKWSDRVYLTSDNPRSEKPEAILEDMRAGISDSKKIVVNPDRKQTIHSVLNSANSGDVVVVAGKGHETYQEINGVKCPFDDTEVIRDWLRANGHLQ